MCHQELFSGSARGQPSTIQLGVVKHATHRRGILLTLILSQIHAFPIASRELTCWQGCHATIPEDPGTSCSGAGGLSPRLLTCAKRFHVLISNGGSRNDRTDGEHHAAAGSG